MNIGHKYHFILHRISKKDIGSCNNVKSPEAKHYLNLELTDLS